MKLLHWLLCRIGKHSLPSSEMTERYANQYGYGTRYLCRWCGTTLDREWWGKLPEPTMTTTKEGDVYTHLPTPAPSLEFVAQALGGPQDQP